jgi:hypothetical protein
MPSIIPQADLPTIHIPLPEKSPPPLPRQKRKAVSQMAKLTEETIRATTKSGDTPLHRAARNGTIHEIPRHLLQTELFMAAKNASFSTETPLHTAAKYGHLDQVPLQFLTKETLTMPVGRGTYTTDSGYVARTETPLHVAVRCGHADQIPQEFLTPQFLSIEAKGDRDTLLHYLAYANRLDLVPEVHADSEMWNLRNRSGQTPRDVLEGEIQRKAYVARVRNESATEKQKDKLGWFGCTWDEGITKGQASDAIDECVRRFPKLDADYYNRPATEEQLAKLRDYLKADGATPEDCADEDKPLTYGQAKDLIWECELEERANNEKKANDWVDKQAKRLRRASYD